MANDPRIDYKPTTENGYKWHCTIHEGPGHHGMGLTKSHALGNAASAWEVYEFREGDILEKVNTDDKKMGEP